MEYPTTASPVDPALLMALAGIAYAEPGDVPRYLAEYAPTAAWKSVWIADAEEVPVNFAFIAQAPTGEFVVAIRGTYPMPLNWAYWEDAAQENPFSPFVAWPYASNGAEVTQGVLDGFTNVLALSGAGTSFTSAISALPTDAAITVVGHSLGGSIAPLVAHWLSTHHAGSVSLATFAGMTPGDAAFASLFGGDGVPADRWWNTLDTVAYGWNDVLGTADFYQPAPQGGPLVKAAIENLAAKLAEVPYASVGTSRPLDGELAYALIGYLFQNLYQHLPNTYLGLFNAPPLPFTLSTTTVVERSTNIAEDTSPIRIVNLATAIE